MVDPFCNCGKSKNLFCPSLISKVKINSTSQHYSMIFLLTSNSEQLQNGNKYRSIQNQRKEGNTKFSSTNLGSSSIARLNSKEPMGREFGVATRVDKAAANSNGLQS